RVDARVRRAGQRGPASVGGQHLIAVSPECGGKRLADGRVVIDYQDPHLSSMRGFADADTDQLPARLCLASVRAEASRAGLTPASRAIAANAALFGSTPPRPRAPSWAITCCAALALIPSRVARAAAIDGWPVWPWACLAAAFWDAAAADAGAADAGAADAGAVGLVGGEPDPAASAAV